MEMENQQHKLRGFLFAGARSKDVWKQILWRSLKAQTLYENAGFCFFLKRQKHLAFVSKQKIQNRSATAMQVCIFSREFKGCAAANPAIA
jgi:hypothetical protein